MKLYLIIQGSFFILKIVAYMQVIMMLGAWSLELEKVYLTYCTYSTLGCRTILPSGMEGVMLRGIVCLCV